MADYENLTNELRTFGLLVEFNTSEEMKPLPNKTLKKVNSFRLMKFFNVDTLKPKQPLSDLFVHKNAVCHGSLSDKEQWRSQGGQGVARAP